MPHWDYPLTRAGNKALVFGHSLLHTYWNICNKGNCPVNWSRRKIFLWHSHHVRLFKMRGFNHNSPLVVAHGS